MPQNTGVAITDVSYNTDTHIATISVDYAGSDGTEIYTITPTSAITDLAGNPLVVSISNEYRTAPTNRDWTASGVIDPGANITTTFSAPMNQSTVENTSNYTLTYINGSSGVSITNVSYNSGSKTATITVSYNLTIGAEVYTITPSSSIISETSVGLNPIASNEYIATDTTSLNIDYDNLISITGGTYTQTDGSESFQHTISDFMIGQYEVTYDLWYTVRTWGDSNGYTFANQGREGDDGTIGAAPTGAKYEPVTYINWRDAIVWCNAYSEMDGLTPVYYTDVGYSSPLKMSSNDGSVNGTPGSYDNPYVDWGADGYRLPTEGEWQYAASNAGNTPYNHASGSSVPYGDNPETQAVAWYSSNSGSHSHDVGTRDPNEYNIYDMSGNVFEWCWDWLDNYPAGPETDYIGATSGSLRIARGGSWSVVSDLLQVGNRNIFLPYSVGSDSGFRIARTQ